MIKGLVASVLNRRELVVNIGSAHGVKRGMKFQILTKEPTEIHDPVTGEVLGMVSSEKARVQVVDVQPRLSVCRTYRKVARAMYAIEVPTESPDEMRLINLGDSAVQVLSDEGDAIR
jgi:hypothetical protein